MSMPTARDCAEKKKLKEKEKASLCSGVGDVEHNTGKTKTAELSFGTCQALKQQRLLRFCSFFFFLFFIELLSIHNQK